MHTRKRQFQPSIDSFFSRTDRAPLQPQPTPPPSRPTSSTPELPPAVQANLLSVGMRVRKAVPEGYKTHKTALFSDSRPAEAARPPLGSSGAAANASQRPRELLPFCGLHRVGGWAVQDGGGSAGAGGLRDRPAEDRFDPEWFSSQESDRSVVVAGSAHKRTHSRIADGEDGENWEEGAGEEDGVADVAMEGAARRFAQPRSRRRVGGSGDGLDGAVATPRNSLDWEEADFLEPWDAEMDGT